MLFEFLGKTPGLVPEEHGGIHIIMDRTTVRIRVDLTTSRAYRYISKNILIGTRPCIGENHGLFLGVPIRRGRWTFYPAMLQQQPQVHSRRPPYISRACQTGRTHAMVVPQG